MNNKSLPKKPVLYQALKERDSSFEGIFFAGITSTGIFCRPTCTARKPKPENVEYFKTTQDAMRQGYRPCKICEPMKPRNQQPNWVSKILDLAEQTDGLRLNDQSIREQGIDPHRLRRWFKKNHNMTFQAYLRSRRLGQAFGHLAKGEQILKTAFDHGYDSLSGFSSAFKKLIQKNPSESKTKTIIHLHQVLTPLGPMLSGMTQKGVCLLEFTDRWALESELKDLSKRLQAPLIVSKGPYLKQLEKELSEYFEGKRKNFSIPLLTPGSEFQNKVWRELQDIPHAKTRSYQEQAKRIGSPLAVRAVARANGQNRVAIVIPCHRVIGSDGKLVGYSGGLARKKYLLELERSFKF